MQCQLGAVRSRASPAIGQKTVVGTAATFYDVGDTWSEATPTFTQVTATLKILGGDADVDNFLQATYADPNDLEAAVIAKRAKAVAHLFSDTFYNGDTAVNAKAFDGLIDHRSIIGARTGMVLRICPVTELGSASAAWRD